MEELKKLVKLIEEGGKGSFNAILDFTDVSSLETQLYYLVKEDKVDDENDALLKLYGGNAKSGAFKMLKSRVKRKLFNQLNFLDFTNPEKFPALLALEIKCNALLNEALILHKIDSVNLKEKIISQALKIAKEAELTNHIIRALDMQRLIYSFKLFNRNKYYELTAEIQKYQKLLRQEEEANELYLAVMIEVRIGVKNRLEHSQFIIENVERISELWKNTGSSVIYGKYYVVKTFILEAFGAITEHIKYLTDSESLYLQGKISPYHFPYYRHLYSLTYAYLKNKQFIEGFITAEKLKTKLSPVDNNWFAHMENYFLLATHSRDYMKAKQILEEVFSNKYLKNNPQFAQERWYLFKEFYSLTQNEKLNYKLNLDLKFITQDKNGYNVWYLILEFIQVLKSLDEELIARNVERLRKYVAKHFDAASDPRTRLFLKLLLIAGHEYSNVKTCQRKSRYLFQKLEQTPFAGDAYAEVEIIPYEHLWEHVLLSIESSTQLWKNSVNSSI
ncbi:hypothetical protein JAO76_09700 [Pontibacter sp. BT310]|uniref:Uncharacterized protein n=1 Tax=Pontibacter populi TaxID=890055 RepID=A0ABS6XCE9_9BACT|nr:MULTISPECIES: hypothetical protein [Pontibacter]MBJ6118465.1 hypothetical protein [Pontibacter sp. BT310]MBR0570894.1 hypothetical protein [Microvirga sp. STS03]MBW3365319.1 hypothetical protein [Pontibacter populi]